MEPTASCTGRADKSVLARVVVCLTFSIASNPEGFQWICKRSQHVEIDITENKPSPRSYRVDPCKLATDPPTLPKLNNELSE